MADTYNTTNYTVNPGITDAATVLGSTMWVDIDNTRRLFNFGERVAELAPQQSPFFTYLSKVSKVPTDDPVFKFLEQRHQWQRRNFQLNEAVAATTYTAATGTMNDVDGAAGAVQLDCAYDQYGREVSTNVGPWFILAGQIVGIEDTSGNIRRFRVTTTPTVTANYTDTLLMPLFSGEAAFADNARGQVIGSAFAENSGAPDGWRDKMYGREGYTQIFKTAIAQMSNTERATRYRGRPNEWMRQWEEKLMEHKMDIEHAMLFGVGSSDETQDGGAPMRYTWGILPYTESYGKTYTTLTYAGSGYDAFLDVMEDFFAPEAGAAGPKLVMASRKILKWLNKLETGNGFLANTVGGAQFRMDVNQIPGKFGHNLLQVQTLFGDLYFVQEPLLRGMYEDYAIAVDLKNLALRPLVGNGINRDTYIETNIQTPGYDGRKDQILTEIGLEISLPETHALMKWS